MNDATTRHPLPQHRIDLPKILDTKQVASFVNDGYLILPDLVSQDDLEALKNDAPAVLPGQHRRPGGRKQKR